MKEKVKASNLSKLKPAMDDEQLSISARFFWIIMRISRTTPDSIEAFYTQFIGDFDLDDFDQARQELKKHGYIKEVWVSQEVLVDHPDENYRRSKGFYKPIIPKMLEEPDEG